MEKIIKNPNKNNELKVLIETLKAKNLITNTDLENMRKQLKK